MNEFINLTAENIDKEHICCAIGDPKQIQKKKQKMHHVFLIIGQISIKENLFQILY